MGKLLPGESPGGTWTWQVFLTCWLVYTVFWTPYIVREHFPALALVEHGSLDVTPYLTWTGDIFRSKGGAAVINNNPGASLTGAVPLWVFRPVLARVDRWNRGLPHQVPSLGDQEFFHRAQAEGRAFYFLLAGFLTVALAMAPATAGTAALLCSRLREAGVPAPHAAQAALLYGLATPVLFRAAYLNHNLLVGDAGITALLLTWDPTDRPLGARRAALSGLLAGYAVLCDYSGLVVVAVTAIYTWLRSAAHSGPRRGGVAAAFAAGVAPGVAALAVYQVWAFGSPYQPSQHFMPPTALTARGYRGFGWPSPALVWANFFDPRFGLFAYCPAMILAFAAPFTTRIRFRIPVRETGILLLYFLLFVLFSAANQYSWLQPSTGFRYLVPVVPVLALLSMQTAQALWRPLRYAVAVAACLQSVVIAAAHQNDVRLAAGTLWQRGFRLPWMIRLEDTGVQVTWVWPFATFGLLALTVALIWIAPRWRAGASGPAQPSDRA
jgi:hypothetical protein